MDNELRELERRVSQGDLHAREALIRSRLRAGTLHPQKVEVASLLGDELCRAVLNRSCMGQSLTWTQADELFPGFIKNVAQAATWPTGQIELCPRQKEDPAGHECPTPHAFEPTFDCEDCKGTGKIDVGASKETLFRCALAAAHTCQMDRMQEWKGQGNAIVDILLAAEGYVEDYHVFAHREICSSAVVANVMRARQAALEQTVLSVFFALPEWIRFDRFFTTELQEEMDAHSATVILRAVMLPWSQITSRLLYEACRARDVKLLRSQIRTAVVPWLLK